MDGKKIMSVVDRYVMATLGMYLSAVGVALSIISNIGTAPLSCPSYVFNLRWPAISVGTFTLIVNCFYVLLQLVLLGRKFKLIDLMQVLASAIFGYMIDLSMATLSWVSPVRFIDRLGLTLFSCLISALGVSMEVAAKAWMLSAEMTVNAISAVTGRSFSNMKIAMDCAVVAISAAAALIFFRTPFGDGNYVVIGIGTVVCAVFIGLCMKLTDPFVARFLSFRRTPWC